MRNGLRILQFKRILEKFYKLDQPIRVQYVYYLKSIVTFDFGPSIKKPNETVNSSSGGFRFHLNLG